MSDAAGRYPPTLRASDADRDVVLAELGEHFQAGRLTSDELEERTGQALQARTFGDLARLTADLPSLTPQRPAASPAGGSVTRPGGRLPLAPLVLGLVAVAVVVSAFTATAGGTRGSHVLWLVILVPLIARMVARRRR